jgi:phasin family protein
MWLVHRTNTQEITMFASPAQFTEFQKTQVDTLNAYSHAVFTAAEKFAQLNLASGRALLRDSAVTAQTLADAKDPQDWLARAQVAAQPTIEKAVNYSRDAYGIASAAGAELSKIVETQVADGNRKFAELVDAAAKSAPAGSEPAVAWVKNAVATSSAAYDALTKAAKQAVEVVESNASAMAAAATDATRVKPRKSV